MPYDKNKKQHLGFEENEENRIKTHEFSMYDCPLALHPTTIAELIRNTYTAEVD